MADGTHTVGVGEPGHGHDEAHSSFTVSLSLPDCGEHMVLAERLALGAASLGHLADAFIKTVGNDTSPQERHNLAIAVALVESAQAALDDAAA